MHERGLVRLLRHMLLLCLASGSLACQTLAPTTGDAKAEDALTLIVAKLQLHLRDDPYRAYPAAADNGQTVFEDAHWRIVRLQEARARAGAAPGDLDLVLHFARGRALERMRRYDEAAIAYEHVTGTASVLAGAALEAGRVMRTFAEHRQPQPGVPDELAAAELRVGQWRELVRDFRDTPWEAMARQEAEAWETLHVEVLARSDSAGAIRAARRLIERNRDSKLLAQHFIQLGDLYADAARQEYLQHRARVRALDVERYDGFLEHAFAAYEQAMDERRPSLRREAATKIESLLAYHAGVRAHAR